MEVGSLREETCTAEEAACEKINISVVEQELETAILEYAISTFPFSSAVENVPGYREEEGTDEASNTDTFAALRLYVDTWRWGDVPFYLRSGKRMARKLTEVVVTFRQTPHCLFREYASNGLRPNQIVINLQRHPILVCVKYAATAARSFLLTRSFITCVKFRNMMQDSPNTRCYRSLIV